MNRGSMEKNGTIYVNYNTTIGQFRRFELEKKNGHRKDLYRAIEFFRERIEERYLRQIKMLNNDSVFDNGFISMAICCLLIDTFYQFEHGVKKTTNNKVSYIDFLRSHLNDVFDTYEKAERFYVDIRCGILHSAQTQNESRLSAKQHDIVQCIYEDKPNSPISVDVRKMAERIETYFNEYCERVQHDETTQTNFVKKLNKMFNFNDNN